MPIERLKKEESELRKKILIRMMKQFAKGLTMHQFCDLINKRVFLEKKWQVAYTTIRTIKNQYNKEHIDDPIHFIDGSNISSTDIIKYNKQAEDSKLLKEQLKEYLHLFQTDKEKLIEIYKKKKAEESKKPQKTQPTKQTYEEYKKQIEENNKNIEYIKSQLSIITNKLKYIGESYGNEPRRLLTKIMTILDDLIKIQLTNKFYSIVIDKIWYQIKLIIDTETINVNVMNNIMFLLDNYDITDLDIESYEKIEYLFNRIYDITQPYVITKDTYQPLFQNISNDKYKKYIEDMKEYEEIIYDFEKKHPDLNQEDYPENIKNAIRTIRKYIIDNNLLEDVKQEYPVNEKPDEFLEDKVQCILSPNDTNILRNNSGKNNKKNEKETFSKNEDIISYTKDNTSLELLKQRELDDTTEKYLLQKELMVLEKKILETFKFLIEELFNGEILEYDKDITRLLKEMYKDGLEGRASGEFNVYQLESILRQINQMDPTSKLKAVIDIYQKFKGEQSSNTVNILNQAGEIKIGGATHKVFNDLDQTNFLEMIDTLEEDLTEKNNNEDN